MDIRLVPEQRRPGVEKRTAMMLMAQCRNSFGDVRTIRVKNLSATGLGGELVRGLGGEPGEAVTLTVRATVRISGVIVWSRGRQLGIAFSRPLDLADLAIPGGWDGPGFEISPMHAAIIRSTRPGLRTR